MSDFSLIVWSRSRPAQLDLLLSSVARFAANQFDIFILFKAGDDKFRDGYELCQSLHPEAEFIDEYDFCKQTKEMLSYRPFSCVATDDSLVFSSFSLNKEMMKDVGCFSLRLGKNTLIQEPFSGRLQPALSRFCDEGETISWDTRDYSPTDNFGFKTGHDFCVYGQRYRELVEELEFKKTNELETRLFYLQDKVNPFMRSFKHSVACNVPSNNMSNITLTDNSLPIEEINDKFLAGKRFRLDEIEKIKARGCHQNESLVMI